LNIREKGITSAGYSSGLGNFSPQPGKRDAFSGMVGFLRESGLLSKTAAFIGHGAKNISAVIVVQPPGMRGKKRMVKAQS